MNTKPLNAIVNITSEDDSISYIKSISESQAIRLIAVIANWEREKDAK